MIFFPDPTTRAVGLDISEHVFRLVEIRRGPFYRRKLQLHRYSEERVPDGVVVAGEFKKPEAVTAHLKSLLKKAYRHATSRGAVVSLPETRTFIKVISVKRPENPEAIPAAILAEAELHIPTPISELYVDWQHMEDPKSVPVGKMMSVTIAAAPKQIVDSYSSALEAAGLVPVAFEIEAQAIVRSVIPQKEDGERTIGIVDFGATRSSFIVYDKGTIQFTVSIPLSGDVVTRRIAESLSVEVPEAERTKRQCGVDAHKCGTKLWSIMEPFLSEMADRIIDAVNFYRDHFPGGRPLDEIVLCGGGANMARMDELLSDLTKTPVRRADPWVNIDPGRSPLPPEIILSSTTAVGLALRQSAPETDAKKTL
ncbi:MAG TPA: type IV pilus assembly protein PilM [Patescibacteria group bacterium]|nr:type IV pilus assembly protein PilM [Patescibacteria group bacterium]